MGLLNPDIWGYPEERHRAAESFGVFMKAVGKKIVGADTSAEDRRLRELTEEADESARVVSDRNDAAGGMDMPPAADPYRSKNGAPMPNTSDKPPLAASAAMGVVGHAMGVPLGAMTTAASAGSNTTTTGGAGMSDIGNARAGVAKANELAEDAEQSINQGADKLGDAQQALAQAAEDSNQSDFQEAIAAFEKASQEAQEAVQAVAQARQQAEEAANRL